MGTRSVVVAWLAAVAVCGCAGRPRVDRRTAVDFEREAQAHRSHAALGVHENDLFQTTQPVLGSSDAMREGRVQMAPGPFLPDLYAAGRVQLDEQAAVKDETIARRLRNDAEVSCERVPPADRVPCPDGGEAGVRTAIKDGVRIELPSGDAESITRVVSCALAEAHVERPALADQCPLLVPGALVRVVGRGIEITSDEPLRVEQIRKAANLPPRP